MFFSPISLEVPQNLHCGPFKIYCEGYQKPTVDSFLVKLMLWITITKLTSILIYPKHEYVHGANFCNL